MSPASNPAPRLTEFVNNFGANGTPSSPCAAASCRPRWIASRTISTLLKPACARNVRDTDPETPGLQADCTVEDIAHAAGRLR